MRVEASQFVLFVKYSAATVDVVALAAVKSAVAEFDVDLAVPVKACLNIPVLAAYFEAAAVEYRGSVEVVVARLEVVCGG